MKSAFFIFALQRVQRDNVHNENRRWAKRRKSLAYIYIKY